MKNVANVVKLCRACASKGSRPRPGPRGTVSNYTLYKTIYGTRGKQDWGESARIREELQKEGFWPQESAEDEVAPEYVVAGLVLRRPRGIISRSEGDILTVSEPLQNGMQ